MTHRTRSLVSLTGGAALVATLFTGLPAQAATAEGPAVAATVLPATATRTASPDVGLAQARYAAYSSGEILHLNALDAASVGAHGVADVEQAFSAGSVSSAGLTHAIVGDRPSGGLVVQPALPSSVHAYASGGGLAAGLAAASAPGDQVQLAGLSTSTSGPNRPARNVDVNTTSLGLPAGLIGAAVTGGLTKTVWGGATCTLGQPLSYGSGRLAAAQVLDLADMGGLSTVTSRLNTLLAPLDALLAGSGAPTASATGSLVQTGSVSNARSETYLSSDPGGAYGLTTVEQEDIAPITVNLLGLATLRIEVGSPITKLPNGLNPTPIDLAATATGQHSGAEIGLTNNVLAEVQVTAGGSTTYLLPPTSLATIVGEGGIHLDLSLGSVLAPLTSKLPPILLAPLGSILDSSLGSVDIATPVRAINGGTTSQPTPSTVDAASSTEGTDASGAFDLAHIDLAPTFAGTTTTVADLALGHMEASASLAAPIHCGLPVSASSPVRSLRAGGSTTLSVQVPTPAAAPFISCSLTDTTVVDTLSGPSFQVTGVSAGARIQRRNGHVATLTWSGRLHRFGTSPLTFSVRVATPKSAARSFRSSVTARTVLQSCGGAPASTLPPGATDNQILTGSTTLVGPAILAARR